MAYGQQGKTGTKGSRDREVAGTSRELSPFEEMDRMWDRFFRSGWSWPMFGDVPGWGKRLGIGDGKLPRVNVIERDTEIAVKAEVPGVQKDDLDISVTEDTLTIRGSTRREEKEEKGDYYRCEMAEGAFARTIDLPSSVDASKVKATFKDGLLEVVMPKREPAKRRTIAVE